MIKDDPVACHLVYLEAKAAIEKGKSLIYKYISLRNILVLLARFQPSMSYNYCAYYLHVYVSMYVSRLG